MDEEKHDKVMTQLTKVFANENLKIGEAISVWYSLGMFLFSHADKEHNSREKIHEAIKQYMGTVRKAEKEQSEQK
ncbi:MAG: hypothetical protein H8E76_11425 [Helicobacteraceae bacterium]|nr:hypothetical protein [Candidatus Sulfurimonas ponti]